MISGNRQAWPLQIIVSDVNFGTFVNQIFFLVGAEKSSTITVGSF